jgi:hypothetical protein
MKTTEKLAFVALAIGGAAAGAVWWFADNPPWWVYAVVWAVVSAAFYRQLVADKAAENVANKDVSGKG